MLIDPDTYIKNIKNNSLEGLIKERDKIIKSIHHYEINKNNREEFDIYPTPEKVYQWNNIVLIKLTNLIMEKA